MKALSLQVVQHVAGGVPGGHSSHEIALDIRLPRPLVVIVAVTAAIGVVLGVVPRPVLAPVVRQNVEITEV